MCLAIPGKIIDIEGDAPFLKKGRVSFGGTIREVHLGYVPDARPGDYVNVHAGFALSIIDEAEAAELLAIWNEVAEKEAERRQS
jgi:hydrogenase expression/formation protein HypC